VSRALPSAPPANGAAVGAPPPDPALGIFETLLFAEGRIHAAEEHLSRLRRSAIELYGLRAPASLPRRLAALERRLAGAERPGAACAQERRVRIDARPSGGRLLTEITLAAPHRVERRPRALAPVTLAGGLGAHKWRDRRLLDLLGADPVPLLVDEHGWVLEAAWANVWLLAGAQLSTPPADGRILPGVTRALLLERAPALGLRACERPISVQELGPGATVLLTSAVRLAVCAAVGRAPAREPDQVKLIRAALRRP